MRKLVCLFIILVLISKSFSYKGYFDDENKCPKVRAIRNFELSGILGSWYIVQYYASSEEAVLYSCMRAEFTQHALEVNMNFTYMFVDDPLREQLQGNITWVIPNPASLAHWVHQEDSYEGVYNTYVLDSDYKSWALLMHCAEKESDTRYFSALLLSRKSNLEKNVISYLRDKLPRYGIDTNYLFAMKQNQCEPGDPQILLRYSFNAPDFNPGVTMTKRHPLQRVHKNRKKTSN